MWLYLLAIACLGLVAIAGVRLYWVIAYQPRRLTGDEFAQAYITNKYFHIYDLVDSHGLIQSRTFEDCWIYGPAVLAGDNASDIQYCTFDGSFDAALIGTDLPPNVVGVIFLKDCKFRKCHFFEISFLTSPNNVKALRQRNFGSGTTHPNEHPPSE